MALSAWYIPYHGYEGMRGGVIQVDPRFGRLSESLSEREALVDIDIDCGHYLLALVLTLLVNIAC